MAREKKELTFLERLAHEALACGRPLGDDDDPRRLTCPLVWEWMTTTEVGKDLVKDPPRLVIQAVPGGFVASIADSGLARTVDVPCIHLDEALEALERGLRDHTAAVRSWGKQAPKLRKRPKPT